jgi:arabinose-5-phosphate isomerase
MDALHRMGVTRLGAAMVVDDDGRLLGIITEGDVRRKIEEVGDIRPYPAGDLMTSHPRVVRSGRLAIEALAIMQAPPRMVNVLPVVDEAQRLVGATHIQDLVQLGLG